MGWAIGIIANIAFDGAIGLLLGAADFCNIALVRCYLIKSGDINDISNQSSTINRWMVIQYLCIFVFLKMCRSTEISTVACTIDGLHYAIVALSGPIEN